MRIGPDHAKLSSITPEFNLESLSSGCVPQLVTESLEESGNLDVRSSPLHPRFVLWMVVGLMLWRYESIPAVFSRLMSGLRDLYGSLSLKAVTEGALAHARARLGVEPLKRLFFKLGNLVNPMPTFRGLRVWAIDGVTFTLQDTKANLRVFGRKPTHRGRTAFCHLRMVGLVAATTHLFRDAVFGLWNSSEVTGAQRLIRHLGLGDLVILDRGFYGLPLFRAIQARGAHFLCRVSSRPKLAPIRGTRQRHEYEAWMKCRVPLEPGEARSTHRGRPGRTKIVQMRVRVIDYRLRGHGRIRLVTSMMDRSAFPAVDLALLYHQRWEAEIAFDEIKTHQNANAHGQLQTTFRSKKPRNVMQEAYALLVTYNLIRGTMAHAAKPSNIDPRQLSFLQSVRALQWMTPRMQSARTSLLPQLYEELMGDVRATLMDRWRRPRAYPRVLRIKMKDFKLKRPHHRQKLLDFEEFVRKAVG